MAGIAPLTTWDKAKEYIDEGTVESLGALGRSEEQLVMYRSFMDKVRRNAPNFLQTYSVFPSGS